MRLYVSNGYLEDAAVLTIEFISAVLGHGKEYFGLETSLQANAPPVWLPHNTIDLIMLELKDHAAADQTYKQVRYESILSPCWLKGPLRKDRRFVSPIFALMNAFFRIPLLRQIK